MLRCSNVATLQVGVGRSMAMKIACSGNTHHWSRVGISSLFAVAARRGPGQIGFRRGNSGLSSLPEYESAISHATDVIENNGDPFSAPWKKSQRRGRSRNTRKSLLLEIALEGTSPKQRERKQKAEGAEAASASESIESAVRNELVWLPDRVSLAKRVKQALRQREVRFAAALVRMAQKQRRETTAAWNHIMEYCLQENEPKAAWRFYNEMKKRGEKPNSVTYTLMLSGLGKIDRGFTDREWGFNNNVNTALAIYKSLLDPKNGIEATITHTNALLTTCLRQKDIDTIWKVAADLPQEGPLAPDEKTYTLILRAIRSSLEWDLEDMSGEEVDKILERQHQAVVEGKKVWFEVAYLWKEGRLPMDRVLVNRMVDLLLKSPTDRELFDVFRLYSQVTGIPILAKEPPKETKNRHVRPKTAETQQDHVNDPESQYIPWAKEGEALYRPPVEYEEVIEEEELHYDNAFDPVISEDESSEKDTAAAVDTQAAEDISTTETAAAENDPVASEEDMEADDQDDASNGKRESRKSLAPKYIPFGNNELSNLLGACQLMTQALGSGKAYWQYLTIEDHGNKIEPDRGVCHQYMRLLRKSHSSRFTLDLIKDQMIPAGLADGTTFHIALSCCQRDRLNPNVFNTTNDIMQLMNANFLLPDPRAVEGYLEFIQNYEKNPQRLIMLNGLDVKLRKSGRTLKGQGQEMRIKLEWLALAVLRPHIAKLGEAMRAHTPRNRPQRDPRGAKYDGGISGWTALTVMNRTRGLMDELLKKENVIFLPKGGKEKLQQESKKLRMYSDASVRNKFSHSILTPTEQQIRAFERGEGTTADNGEVVGEEAEGDEDDE